jgi:hypothetical protein
VLLLNLLDPTSPYADYYSRLYSVQILTAICAARPDRLQECILAAPLGVSRLVGVLDDGRDAVRNAGLLLLVDLTSGANEELRKIVAFEDVFGKTFALIQLEGGLAEAGITAQDCLSLLANLIRGSGSNQAMFRESGCVSQMVQLLQQAFPTETEAAFNAQGREKAAWGSLQLLRLFFIPGEASTPQNQVAFFRAGTAQVLIDLGFSPALPPPIRASSLRAVAALIDCNPPLQEAFAPLMVITPADAEHNTAEEQKRPQSNGIAVNGRGKTSTRASLERRRSYIIEALLNLCLDQREQDPLLRAAACGLIQAYLAEHDVVKGHFLRRAVAGHAEGETSANVLVTLLHPPENDVLGVVHASWIVQGLVVDSGEGKAIFAAVKEGNEEEGEDVVTAIQALGTQLQASLQAPVDERMVAAYASLLTTLLWDFAVGVDDLLAEGSSLLQGLLAVVKTPSDPIVTGLAAVLLGVIYEFSTKDSPIPRRTLAPLLQQKLGRTKYLDALLQLRRQPAIRDFDLDQETDEGGDGLLSNVFVNIFQLEYTRLRRAVDKDPGVEVLPDSAVEAGVDRDIFDDLRQQAQSAKDAMMQAQQEAVDATQKAEQDRLNIGKELQTATAEIQRLRKINEAMQQAHEAEFEKLTKQHEQEKNTIQTRHQHAINAVRQEVERASQATLRERDAAAAQKIRELERRIAELGNEHRKEANGHATVKQQLESTTTKLNELIKRDRDLNKELEGLKQQQGASEKKLVAVQDYAKAAESKLEAAVKALEGRGEEIKQLKAQISELQQDVDSRDKELEAERAGFADLEKKLSDAQASLEATLSTGKQELEAAQKAAADAEAKALVAEEKAAEAEKTTQDAEKKVSDAWAKATSAEEKLKDAVQKAISAEKKTKHAEERAAAAEAKATEIADNGKGLENQLADAKKKTAEALTKAKAAEEKLKETVQKAVAAEKKAKEAEEKLTASEKKGSEGNKSAGGKGNQGSNKADKDKIAKLEKELEEAKKAKAAAGKAEKSDGDKVKKLESDMKKAQEGENAAKEKLKQLEKVEDDLKAAQESEKTLKEQLEKYQKLEDELKTAQESEDVAKQEVERLRKLEDDLKAAQEAQNSATAEIEKLRAFEADLETVKGEKKVLEAELEKLKRSSGELSRAQRALKQAQESEKSAKEELESMLLVMGDIESKREEYKTKIKELGGEVSEDDEDDDDEDDDDEDEDEDEDEDGDVD